MEESTVKAPLYYVLGREADDDMRCAAFAVLMTTPCHTGVVSRHSDKTLIQSDVLNILQAHDEDACENLAAHVGRACYCPVLTVGKGNRFTAVYPDGEREEICLSKLIGTNSATAD